MFYIICQNTPKFFSSFAAAQDELDRQYMSCLAEIRPVPLGRTHYSVAYGHPDICEVRFYPAEMARHSVQVKMIEVER